MDSVILVGFDDDSKAYEALTKLNELDSQHQLDLVEAEVVIRGDDGRVDVKDEVNDFAAGATVTGGLLGLLIGVLGGPLGIIVGGASGLFVGSLFDLDDADETDSALGALSRTLRPGRHALLAQLQEPSTEVVDAAMADLGGTVLAARRRRRRTPEIAAAEDAQREAKKAARKQLLHQRHEQHKDKIRAKIAELKAKLHRHSSVGAAS